MNKKRKHITLTIEEKLKIIEMVEAGNISRQTVAHKFGIGKSTVHDIHKRRDKIREFAMTRCPGDMSKRRRVAATFRTEALDIKQEIELGGEEMNNSIEDFDYQEINEPDYEIVYEEGCSLPLVTDEVDEKPIKDVSAKAKRKSRTLTFREKCEVIMMIENGSLVPVVCAEFGIGRTTVYDIMRRKQEIFEFVEKSSGADRRTFKKSKFPEVEERVVAWCESNDNFTKNQFHEKARETFEDLRYSGSSSVPSGFCGSWSWSKRFFNRHPQLRRKLIKSSGEPEDEGTVEYLDENINEENSTKIKICEVKSGWAEGNVAKYLTTEEKLLVLNEIDAGKPVADIANAFNIEKSTVYEIFKRRSDLRGTNIDYSMLLKKAVSTRVMKYPQLELELLRWCLNQKIFPLSKVLIADQALCLFDSLGLQGSFKPSSEWARKFVMRHPELYEKQEIFVTDEAHETQEVKMSEEFEEEMEERLDSETNGSLDFMFCTPDYQEEYIVEELEPHLEENENDGVTELHEETIEIEPEEERSTSTKLLEAIKEEDPIDVLVPDKIALKSLKILIKYSEQQGHIDILSHLIDYHNQLYSDVS